VRSRDQTKTHTSGAPVQIKKTEMPECNRVAHSKTKGLEFLGGRTLPRLRAAVRKRHHLKRWLGKHVLANLRLHFNLAISKPGAHAEMACTLKLLQLLREAMCSDIDHSDCGEGMDMRLLAQVAASSVTWNCSPISMFHATRTAFERKSCSAAFTPSPPGAWTSMDHAPG